MKTKVQWTTAAERALIVEEALGLLERVGMRFGPCDALDALAESGAAVDRERGVARIPAEAACEARSRRPHAAWSSAA